MDQMTGAALLAGLGLVLMVADRRSAPWESLLILATISAPPRTRR
ncbi:hypothetical protein ACFV4T_31470 [Streptomyces sp. NPDC059755]